MTACNAKGEAKTADTAKSTRSKYTDTSQNIKEHDSNLSFRSIISQNPMLSSEEKKELINKKETEEWPEARKKLVLGNLRLVASIAKEYVWMDDCSFDDIMSHGVIGLMKALDHFDLEADTKFSTYGTKWIRQEIRDGLLYKRGIIRTPAYMEKLITKFKKSKDEFIQKGIGNPSVAMLSEQMGVPEKKIQQILEICKISTISLDELVNSGSDSILLGDTLFANAEDEAVEKITLKDVAKAMKKLKPVEQKVIMMRFGFMNGEPMTLEQCARETGYSIEGCRHIQETAIQKLQADYMGRK